MSMQESRGGCPRDASGRFTNPWSTWFEHSWWDLIVHFFTATHPQMTKEIEEQIPVLVPEFERHGNGICATWLGHATFYVDMGVRVLTDPVFDHPIGPWFWPIRRFRPSPCPIKDLPRVDIVTISHDHFDHYNPKDLQELARHQPWTRFVVPLGMKALLVGNGLCAANIDELDWWQSVTIGATVVTLVPAQHWSGRSYTRNETLWGGMVVEHQGLCCYHAGDTGYCSVFADIGARFSIDIALLPIGACEPRQFMRPHHVNADDALEIHRDVKARFSIAMHHSTFLLSSTEPILGPRDHLSRVADPLVFACILPGASVELPSR